MKTTDLKFQEFKRSAELTSQIGSSAPTRERAKTAFDICVRAERLERALRLLEVVLDRVAPPIAQEVRSVLEDT